MLHIGCHLSSSKGFLAMGREALSLGADTFQFFTRNPRGNRAKDLDPADAQALSDLLRREHFAPGFLCLQASQIYVILPKHHCHSHNSHPVSKCW